MRTLYAEASEVPIRTAWMWVLAGCAAAPEVPSDGAMGLFDRDAAYGRRPIPSLAPWDPASFPNPDGVPFVDTLKGAVVGLGPARSGAIVLPLDRAVDLAPGRRP
jgi:hypothetical protein